MVVVTGVNMKTRDGHPGGPTLLTCEPLRTGNHNQTFATTPSVDHGIARHMQDGGVPRRRDVGILENSFDAQHVGAVSSTQYLWSGADERIETLVKPGRDACSDLSGNTGTPRAPRACVWLLRRCGESP